MAAMSLELALTAIVALAIAGLAAVWLIPKWQAQRWRNAGIEAEKAAELENSARGTIVQLVGGVALILTFVATWAQIADSRRASERTLELAAQQQQSERFSRAIEQLASPRLVSRVAAMAGLDAVIRGPVRADREPAVQVILAYLRTAHRPGGGTYYDEIRSRDCSQPSESDPGDLKARARGRPRRPDPDMQAAVTALAAHVQLEQRLHNLSRLDFTALDAESADFSGANLSGAVLSFANLNGARFSDTELADTRFYRACLRNASFSHAPASGVLFIGADLTSADLSNADLSRGNLQSSGLEGASFDSADLQTANLEGARLRGASFESADLRGAWLADTDVSEEQLRAAKIDGCTRLPWRPHVSEECTFPGSVG
jgi:uncharacterized protein YjbI with pentapeptide repeats